MKLRFLPIARQELFRAARWYEARSPGRGDQLLDEVQAALALIKQFPEAHPSIGRARRIRVNRFPYVVVYGRSASTDLIILAIAHTKRRPAYWSRRQKSIDP